VAALIVWIGAAVAAHVGSHRVHAGGATPEGLARARRLQRVLAIEHGALALGLLSGLVLMWMRGWGVGHPRWLAVKLGLTLFLLLPLEGMHAYVSHVWIRRGLRQTAAPPYAKDLRRGLAMDEMVRTLSLVLLGPAVPLLVWLSVWKPW
jgi:hypothetical protein